jgi:hypothetical protein
MSTMLALKRLLVPEAQAQRRMMLSTGSSSSNSSYFRIFNRPDKMGPVHSWNEMLAYAMCMAV